MIRWKRFCAALLCFALVLSAIPCLAAEHWDWNKAYYSFLMDGWYKQSKEQKYFVNKDNWEEPMFVLHDVNLDGVPELLAFNGCSYTADARGYLYTFYNGDVVYSGDVSEYLDQNFYYEGNTQYPGLFFYGWGRGEGNELYYAHLEGSKLVLETVANWNESDMDWDTYKPIPGSYTQTTTDQALFDLAENHLRKIALGEDIPSDYTYIRGAYSLNQIAAMGWDAFTAQYKSISEERNIVQLPRVTFRTSASNQLTIHWETDDSHLYSLSVKDAVTGEELSYRMPELKEYGEDELPVEDKKVYEITVSTHDWNTGELIAENDTLYVSVTLAKPLTQEQQEKEMVRRGSLNLIAAMGTQGTEENNLLNNLYRDYENSFAHIYMGELDDNLEYQFWSAGYNLLSDTVSFIIDGVNDIMNDPVEMALIQVLTDYLTSQENMTEEKLEQFSNKASWVGDTVEFLISSGGELLPSSVETGINAMNRGLQKIFPRVPADLVKGLDKYVTDNKALSNLMGKSSNHFEVAGKLFSGVIALLDYAVKEGHNTAVVSVLMGNYAENIEILGDLYEQAQTEEMKNAIQRVARWMTNQLEDDLGQLYDETSEMGKWVLSLAGDLGAKALASQTSGAAKFAGNAISTLMLGQAIGSLVTKSAGDYIDANQKVAATNKAAYILKIEADYAVQQGNIYTLTWLDMFANETDIMNNATVLAVDAVHRESFLRKIGDKIRDIKGNDLNDHDYDMIMEDSNRISNHRIQLAEARVQHVLGVKDEVIRENTPRSGIVVYYQPEQAALIEDEVYLYASHEAQDNDLICKLPIGCTVSILGELTSTKNGKIWYLVCTDSGTRGFLPASSVQR